MRDIDFKHQIGRRIPTKVKLFQVANLGFVLNPVALVGFQAAFLQAAFHRHGTVTGNIHFQFKSEQLVYPLKITQISVREKTEALFYVQAPFKVDLPGDFTYQYQ